MKQNFLILTQLGTSESDKGNKYSLKLARDLLEKVVYQAVKLKNYEQAAKFQKELTEINDKIYPTLVTIVAV